MKINLSTLDYISYKKPNFEGNEGKLYIHGSEIHKFYHKYWQYTDKKIDNLTLMQPSIKYTTMPVGSIYVEDIFMGTILKYFNNHKKMIELKNIQLDLIIQLLKQLKVVLEELTGNYVYPTDLDDENILVSKTGKIEIIDLDGLDTLLCEKQNDNYLKKVLNLYKNIILDFLYPKYDKIICYHNPAIHLEEIGLPTLYIDLFTQSELNYDILSDLIDYTKKEKTYKR